MFKLTIKTGNEAYQGGSLTYELARNLQDIAGKLQAGNTYGSVMDTNGNKVGSWEVK